uniref:Chromosome 10 open reading frame 88 n=1 Tax=Salvator merianae TaxID=96440 RepID=A0A8D0BG93_SALMN
MAASSSRSSCQLTTAASEDAEASVVFPGRPPRISVACSWECQADLASTLTLAPEGDFDVQELWRTPQDGENIMLLEGHLKNDCVDPCLLYLHCDPHGSEEIISLGILSEARNMEVYIGDEYCATGKGEKVFTVQCGSKGDQVTLYKKYLKLECSTVSCKIKLLSICEKYKVHISKILVQIKPACMKSVPDFPAVGSGIDLGKVQAIMDSMGSKLSPGAQQLLDMVCFQQKNGFSFGGKLQNILGRNGFGLGNNHTIDGFHVMSDPGSLDHLPNGPSLLKVQSATGTVIQDLKTCTETNKQIPKTEDISGPQGFQCPQTSAALSQSDFRGLVSSFLKEQGNEHSNVSNSALLLPFLQTVCGQVNRLRIDERSRHCVNNTASEEDGIQTAGVEQQPICLYLEKVISKNMDLMEKRLMNYIDLRIQKLQEHLDNKVAALIGFPQNPSVLQECDQVGEEYSNAKR